MRRNMIWLFVILVSVLVFPGLTGCGQRASSVVVKTLAASQQDMEVLLQLSGVLVPVQNVDISSKISGRVEKIEFGVGSQVKQGDVLIQLDTESINGQLMQSQAALRSAQAAMRTANNQAELARITLEAAQRSFDRKAALLASGAVSQSEMDEARDELDTAQNRYSTASGPALEQAQAAIDTAQANIRNFNIQLDNATIRSPIDGILASQNIDAGEVLSTGTTVISVVDTSILKMKSTVTQAQVSCLKIGQSVEVVVDGCPRVYTGIVNVVGPVSVSTGEVFPVEISLKNDGTLMAGMAAQARATVKMAGIIVPDQAVVQKSGESLVYVIQDGAAIQRIVAIGFSNGQTTQIVKGLDQGEQVVVSNASALADGTRIEVQ